MPRLSRSARKSAVDFGMYTSVRSRGVLNKCDFRTFLLNALITQLANATNRNWNGVNPNHDGVPSFGSDFGGFFSHTAALKREYGSENSPSHRSNTSRAERRPSQ